MEILPFLIRTLFITAEAPKAAEKDAGGPANSQGLVSHVYDTPPPGPSEQPKASATALNQQGSPKAHGLWVATRFSEADRTKKEIALESAAKYAKLVVREGEQEAELTDDAEEFLTGFAEGFADRDTAKNRKKEMRAIFEAYATASYAVKVADVEPATKLPKKDKDGNIILIEVAKPGSEWLKGEKAQKMGWNSLYSYATDIRGKRGGGAGVRKPKSVKDKDMERMENLLHVSTVDQAQEVVARALDTVGNRQTQGWEERLMAEMLGICRRVSQSSDLHYQMIGQDLAQRIAEDIAERERLALEAKAGVKLQAPAPAEAAAKTGTHQ